MAKIQIRKHYPLKNFPYYILFPEISLAFQNCLSKNRKKKKEIKFQAYQAKKELLLNDEIKEQNDLMIRLNETIKECGGKLIED